MPVAAVCRYCGLPVGLRTARRPTCLLVVPIWNVGADDGDEQRCRLRESWCFAGFAGSQRLSCGLRKPQRFIPRAHDDVAAVPRRPQRLILRQGLAGYVNNPPRLHPYSPIPKQALNE
jgi:hypothetical protein